MASDEETQPLAASNAPEAKAEDVAVTVHTDAAADAEAADTGAASETEAGTPPSEHDPEYNKRLEKYNALAIKTKPHMKKLRDQGDTEANHPHKHFGSNAPGLRAAVMGANDGLVSVSSLIFGVLGGSFDHQEIVIAAVAALIGGAISMAIGELISVWSARDCQEADIKQEKKAHGAGEASECFELAELAMIYENKGLSPKLALEIAVALSAKDVLQAHYRDELGIDTEDLDNPWAAAFFSFFSFIGGAFFPVLVCILITDPWTLFAAMAIVSCICMIALGAISAHVSGASKVRTCARIMAGGLAGMAVTYVATWGVSELLLLTAASS